MKTTTLEMEIALLKAVNPRQNLTVLNPSWGLNLRGRNGVRSGVMHECDLLYLTKSMYATEIEIKISKGDLLKDKGKRHGHNHNHIARLYFAVPEKLEELALQEIPERAGLFVVYKYEATRYTYDSSYKYLTTSVRLSREAKRNPNAVKWTTDEAFSLARLGTIRVLPMKQKIHELKCNIEELRKD